MSRTKEGKASVGFAAVDAIAMRPKVPKSPREQKEGDLSRSIMGALAFEPGLLLWRNSIGTFRAHGFHVRAGLPKGSADLVGLLTVKGPWGYINGGYAETLTGRFVALEVKKPREKADAHQAEWLSSVRTHAGFAAVVTSVEEARAAIARARAGALE